MCAPCRLFLGVSNTKRRVMRRLTPEVPVVLALATILLTVISLPRGAEGWHGKTRTSSVSSLLPPSHRALSVRADLHVLLASSSNNSNEKIPPTFPLARRTLIEKAKQIDPAIEKSPYGSYSTIGWSNRLGTVLTPAAVPGVYEAGRPFIWNGIDVGCRMGVIELSTSSSSSGKPDLFVHSPVGLDDRLADAIDAIGNVAHVVSPNYEHVKYAYQWAERYPDACIWGCPGLEEREPLVRWTGELPYGTRPPEYVPGAGEDEPPAKTTGKNGEEMWDWNEVQPLHVDTEVNPFTGRPFFNEVVFYHTASKTLLCTDTFWNYPRSDGVPNANYAELPGGSANPTTNPTTGEEEADFGAWELAPEVGKVPFGSSLWKIGMDRLFSPFYLNLMVKSDARDRFRGLASFMSGVDDNGWDVETVIPAHGDIIRGKTLCRTILKDHFKL
mmetsp:Transcript_11430/g.25610  ORF Transcript_11430/g.25610 Transcript_11430/m.25610 type:complete len:442 (-) Transcript_11430:76-1401(-)